MGEVLFWTFRCCVGTEIYNAEMSDSVVRLYSRVLRCIVPTAIAMEIGKPFHPVFPSEEKEYNYDDTDSDEDDAQNDYLVSGCIVDNRQRFKSSSRFLTMSTEVGCCPRIDEDDSSWTSASV